MNSSLKPSCRARSCQPCTRCRSSRAWDSSRHWTSDAPYPATPSSPTWPTLPSSSRTQCTASRCSQPWSKGRSIPCHQPCKPWPTNCASCSWMPDAKPSNKAACHRIPSKGSGPIICRDSPRTRRRHPLETGPKPSNSAFAPSSRTRSFPLLFSA